MPLLVNRSLKIHQLDSPFVRKLAELSRRVPREHATGSQGIVALQPTKFIEHS